MLIPSLVAAYSRRACEKSDQKSENQLLDVDKKHQFTEMLKEGEELLVVCPAVRTRKYYLALTNDRLLIEGKRGLADIPRDSIRKVVGCDLAGNKVKDLQRVMVLHVTADKKYRIINESKVFYEIVKELM